MKNLFEEPVLDQMYEFRKDDFEQEVYDNNKEIQNIELQHSELAENLIQLIRDTIKDEERAEIIVKKFEEFQLDSVDSIEFWNKTYFKLGMIEREEIKKTFLKHELEKSERDSDTFLNFPLNCLSEYIETQKRKYTLNAPDYKKLMKQYREISEKYPNAIAVFEDLEPIVLNKEEMKALVELREIDLEIGSMEKDLCFKLGMKEVINF